MYCSLRTERQERNEYIKDVYRVDPYGCWLVGPFFIFSSKNLQEKETLVRCTFPSCHNGNVGAVRNNTGVLVLLV